MYLSNPERNKIIYEFWEKGLTVSQISFETGIPRSTVGYYVRKFNRLAAEGKPAIFPTEDSIRAETKVTFLAEIFQLLKIKTAMDLHDKIIKMVEQGEHEKLYYFLQNLKLIVELKSLLIP